MTHVAASIIIITTTIFTVLSSTAPAICERPNRNLPQIGSGIEYLIPSDNITVITDV